MENIFGVSAFICFELAVTPLISLRSFFNVIFMSINLGGFVVFKKTIQYLVFGWIIVLYMCFRDVYSLLKILWNENGFK